MLKYIILIVTIATALLPIVMPFITKFLHLKTHRAPVWLSSLAAVIFFISFYLPDVHISPETSTFQQHLVGGGMYCAVLYAYIKKLLGWRFYWPIDFIILLAWVSAFGVANELLEFSLVKSHIMTIDISDTSWDLLANTIGAFLSYGVVQLTRYVLRKFE
jgi:hypothetical protein